MAQFKLVVRSGPIPGKVFTLSKSELFVGRADNNDIVINDAEVSRRHARFFAQAGSYLLEDLGSTNGTFANGQRLTRPTPLRPGMTIRMGENVVLSFEAESVDAAATVVTGGGAQATIEAAPPQVPPRQAPPRAAPRQAAPPRPAAPPPASPQAGYAGRVPPGPDAFEEAPRKRSRLPLLLGCVGVLVIGVCVVAAAAWYIDANFLWCDVDFLGIIPGCG
jgi:predicted component of type VI protein secretion system